MEVYCRCSHLRAPHGRLHVQISHLNIVTFQNHQLRNSSKWSSQHPFTMLLRIWGLLLSLVSIVSALSATGNKLLVILEEESERNKYSQFWADLESEYISRLHTIANSSTNTTPHRKRLLNNHTHAKGLLAFALPPWRTSLLPPPHPPSQIERPRASVNA